MSCHCCLTLADCRVASCHAAAYHPPVPAPLLISVVNAPCLWLLFHIVVSSSTRDPLRPFPHPPRLQTADWQGKGIAESCRGAIVIIVVVLDGSASSPPPKPCCCHHPRPLGCRGRNGCRGGGMMQPPVVAAFLAYIVFIVLPQCRLNPCHLLCCAPAGLPALPPPPPAPRTSSVSPNRRTLRQARQAQWRWSPLPPRPTKLHKYKQAHHMPLFLQSRCRGESQATAC
jgi:hypothetical protein